MKIDDRVRIVGVTSGLTDDNELNTRSLFEPCVGREFPVMEIEQGLLELHVGEVNGKPAFMESIWIEPEFVEAAKAKS